MKSAPRSTLARNSRGVYWQSAHKVTFRDRTFAQGKGSRTPLRRIFEVGDSFSCDAPRLLIACEITKSYEVASRRHYPKVIDRGGSGFSAQHATWHAQSAMRREFRGTGSVPASREHLQARLHGFFAAVVSGPLMMPSEWLGYVTDFSVIPDAEAAQALVGSVMLLYNDVAHQLHEDRDEFVAYVSSLQNADTDGEALLEWSRGYFDAVALRAQEWEEFTRDKHIRDAFMPFAMALDFNEDRSKQEWLSDAEFRGNFAQSLGVSALAVRDLWRGRLFPQSGAVRRSGPKISPNAPCPCGSGKKYKRCCGSPVRLVKD